MNPSNKTEKVNKITHYPLQQTKLQPYLTSTRDGRGGNVIK